MELLAESYGVGAIGVEGQIHHGSLRAQRP
jgi:hypothetical protein